MKKIALSVLALSALFAVSVVSGQLGVTTPTPVAHAAPFCVAATGAVPISNLCGTATRKTFASVSSCSGAVTAVQVNVFDGLGNLLETFALANNGSGTWFGSGTTCINAYNTAFVTFTATGGTIDQNSAVAKAVSCGC